MGTPKVGKEEALSTAKQIALLNKYHWDDTTAKAELRDDRLPLLYWDVMPGYEKPDETSAIADWLALAPPAEPLCILIDAQTGEFAGLDMHGSKPAIPARELVCVWSFKFPEKKSP